MGGTVASPRASAVSQPRGDKVLTTLSCLRMDRGEDVLRFWVVTRGHTTTQLLLLTVVLIVRLR